MMKRYRYYLTVPLIVGLIYLLSARIVGQQLHWDYPVPDGFYLYIDGVRVATIADPTIRSYPITPDAATHRVGISAFIAQLESSIVYAPSPTVPNAPLIPSNVVVDDPTCIAPLGINAPSVFITRLSVTTGKPHSRSAIDFQAASAFGTVITRMSVWIDGLEDPSSVITGNVLSSVRGLWFTQPATGMHGLGVQVMNSHGCVLYRAYGPGLMVP